MRHYNSPEEIAKRTGEAVEPAKRGQGFRHYNSPEEVAKRGGQSAPVAPQRRPYVAPVVEDWPLAGEDNTAMVRVEASPPQRFAPSADLVTNEPSPEQRLALLERLVHTLCESPAEAREIRVLLKLRRDG